MKKLLLLLLMLGFTFALTACGEDESGLPDNYDPNLMKDYSEETIVVYFVPSRPADEILEMVGPLEQMLEDELAKLGFEVGEVQVLVSSTYEAAGEALLAGTGDIAFLPGGTYVAYKDVEDSPLQVMVAATRAGLTKDSMDAMAWNDGLATDNDSENQVEYYKGLIIAGTSAAARTVSDKVNSGADLVWDDVKDLNWCVRSATSSSGYIYPNIWLQENFGMTFDDIEGDVVSTSGYGDSAASIASGVCDVATFYADARMHNAEKWTTDFGRTATIWEETDVIGVTANIMNDTITASTVNLGQDMIVAIKAAFMNIAQTEEGLAVIDVYSHEGYVVVTDEDYDDARTASEMAGN